MPLTGNAINVNSLATLAQRAGPQVTAAIRQASLKTGVDFAYLMNKANTESSFDSTAHANGSSARGLYQFINSTWLQMVKRYGDKYGLGDYAAQISDSGKVSSPQAKKEILALRDDPQISALMAGELSAENRQSLTNLGVSPKDIGSTELYLAHFLGAGSAAQYIKAMKANPLAPAATLFPAAARANPNLFYTKTRHERSLGDIYAIFDKKFQTPGDSGGTALAANDSKGAAQAASTGGFHYASNSILRTIPAANIPVDAQRTAMLQMMMGDNSGDSSLIGDLYNVNAAPQTLPPALPGASLFSDPAILAALGGTQAATTPAAAATHAQGIRAYLLHALMQAI